MNKKKSKLVVVGTFLNVVEAELAQGALQAGGIDAMVTADDMGGQRPSLWMGGIRVKVRSEDVQKAARLLQSLGTKNRIKTRRKRPV